MQIYFYNSERNTIIQGETWSEKIYHITDGSDI